MVESVELKARARHELMEQVLPDDEEISVVPRRVVSIEESRRIDQIMNGSDAGILGRVLKCCFFIRRRSLSEGLATFGIHLETHVSTQKQSWTVKFQAQTSTKF